MSKRYGYDYSLLDHRYGFIPYIPLDRPFRKFYSPAAIECAAVKMTEHWPGFPADPSQPVYDVDTDDIFPPIKPEYVSRRRKRGGGYANLYNYNTIP